MGQRSDAALNRNKNQGSDGNTRVVSTWSNSLFANTEMQICNCYINQTLYTFAYFLLNLCFSDILGNKVYLIMPHKCLS